MTIRDCQGQAIAKAFDGRLMFRNAKDSTYEQKRSNTENALIIRDLGNPPTDLIRITMKEPCRPFPPFCAQMGMWNWFIHGYTWQGDLLTPGWQQNMGGFIGISMSSGEAEDMRFLTLYSTYTFSNIRWSPFMTYFFLACLLCGCGCCCYCCCWRSSEPEPEAKNEETMKLMQTKEIECEAPVVEKQPAPSLLACCSRRGRTVAPN